MLPALYHAHLELHPDDLSFWLDLAFRYPGPILELGCGTGRLLLALARAGHSVYGLDKDFQMLEFLQKNHLTYSPTPAKIIQADFTRFHLAMAFKLIVMPCNTFSTILPSARLSLLACVRRHLLPQGLFAASLPNPEALLKLPANSDPEVEEVFPHPNTGEPVQVLSSWERSEGHFTVRWHYDHLQPDGYIQRSSLEIKHNLTTAQAYQHELQQAGFQTINFYGDYDISPYRFDSPFLIILAGSPD